MLGAYMHCALLWCRLLEDALCTLPCHDPLASDDAWRQVKASSAFKRSCQSAYDACSAMAAMVDDGSKTSWQMQLAKGRCLRKQREPTVNWLDMLARACHFAGGCDAGDGGDGVLLPFYALHATRMRLLLAMPSAARWAAPGSLLAGRSSSNSSLGGARLPPEWDEEQGQVLEKVGSYCFQPSNAVLRSTHQPHHTSAAAEAEGQATWLALLEDCCAAMRWCLDRDKTFHRAAYRYVQG